MRGILLAAAIPPVHGGTGQGGTAQAGKEGKVMTKREFFMLWAAKEDIRARAERLEALKSLAAAGAVNGQEVDLNRLTRELEEKNRALAREVPQALALIETAGSPALRCALHMVCMEGCGWDEVAARLGRGSADSWKKAVHRFCDSRLEKE